MKYLIFVLVSLAVMVMDVSAQSVITDTTYHEYYITGKVIINSTTNGFRVVVRMDSFPTFCGYTTTETEINFYNFQFDRKYLTVLTGKKMRIYAETEKIGYIEKITKILFADLDL